MLRFLEATMLGVVLLLAAQASAAEITFTTVLKKNPTTQQMDKVWVPATQNVPINEKITINLINELDLPHGFEIPGMVPATVVFPTKEKGPQSVTVTFDKAGNYPVKCHLHPAHVGAQLVVLAPVSKAK